MIRSSARTITFFARHLHQAQALEPETEAARQSLARDLERLTHWGQQYLQSPGESSMPGWRSSPALEQTCGWNSPPHCRLTTNGPSPIVPCYASLARLDEDYTNALLVLVDSRAARIYEVVLGASSQKRILPVRCPDDISKGGPGAVSTARRSISIAITKRSPRILPYMTAHPHTQLILSGHDDIVAGFRHWLAPSVQLLQVPRR